MRYLAPIILFTYNRPWHTLQTLQALQENDLANQSILYVYSDGPKENATEEDLKKIEEVRTLAKSRQWCKEVILVERDRNWGLADNIVDGVTRVVNEYGKIIVLEDDIVTSKGFLRYMNEALEVYENEERVMHVSGYIFPVTKKLPNTFFYNATSCWGWGTWKRAWSHFNTDAQKLLEELDSKHNIFHFNIDGSYNFYDQLKANTDGRLKTWAIKWHTSVYLKNGLCLHPFPSLVENIGMDGSGVHCGVDNSYNTQPANYIQVHKIKLSESKSARKAVKKFHSGRKTNKRSITSRIKTRVRQLLDI